MRKKEVRAQPSLLGRIKLYSANLFLVACRYLGLILGWIREFDRENFPVWPTRVVMVSNHPSLYEPQYLVAAFGPYSLVDMARYVPISTPDKKNYSKKLAWAEPCLEWIPRGSPVGQGRALVRLIKRSRLGRNIGLFPEGGRTGRNEVSCGGNGEFVYSKSGQHRIRPFEEGIGKLVVQTGCTVQLVWIEGAEKVLPIGTRFPRFWRGIRVYYGKPIKFERVQTKDRNLRAAEAARITANLQEKLLELADAKATVRRGRKAAPPHSRQKVGFFKKRSPSWRRREA